VATIFGITDWILGIFELLGPIGMVVFIFLLFFIDAILVPTLPELFFTIAYMDNPSIPYGLVLIAAASVAEILGVMVLYTVVSHLKVPRFIENAVGKYVNFLILGDERLLLINRVAPMIPFSGAFIKIAGWDLRKSMVYIVIGCVVKYGIIMLLCGAFFTYFTEGDARSNSMIFILIVIGVSFVASFLLKKKKLVVADKDEHL